MTARFRNKRILLLETFTGNYCQFSRVFVNNLNANEPEGSPCDLHEAQ